jgi:type VII secretion-associated serine protease mycosin
MRMLAALTALAVVFPVAAAPGPALAEPQQTIRQSEWMLTGLQVFDAWKYSKGDKVLVAVLDTGVSSIHRDLIGSVTQGPDYTGTGTPRTSKFWGVHGTNMAGIIAGHGNGPGHTLGVFGIAPKARILSIRVTWENKDPARNNSANLAANRDAVAKAIRYAADHGAQVINMSLGGGNSTYNGNPAEQTAIEYARSKGAVLVASMGNDGAGQNQRNYPAAYPGVIAVGATGKNFKPLPLTNRQDYVSVAAPGQNVVSTTVTGGYSRGTGTSSSTAIVAGIAALIKARYPRLSPDQVKLAIETGATHRPASGHNNIIGYGVVNAFRALKAAYRINKSGPAVAQPAVPAPAKSVIKAEPLEQQKSVVFFATILGGGSLLLVVGLLLAWRQRRSRTSEPEQLEPLVPSPAPAPEPPAVLRPYETVPTGPRSGSFDPLSAPIMPDVPAATPLADETWRSVQQPADEQDFRPPWA